MKYAFIGGGNMGRALASALIGKGVCLPGEILVVDPDEAARERLDHMGCAVQAEVDDAVGKVPVVLLAVKPQSAGSVYPALSAQLQSSQVVVSIMAGVPVGTLQRELKHEPVVRVMPNTPAQVGLGMNVYYAVPAVGDTQLRAVEALLQASGEALPVDHEDAIDAATAISGSGPAYVFYVAENWMRVAEELGFSEAQATQLVQQTLIGATALWKDQREPVARLREQVTSKGGTTAAALEHMEQHQVGAQFAEGVRRAYRRAKELAQ